MAYNFRWQIARVDGYQQHPELPLQDVVGEVYWELEVRDTTDGSIHYLRAGTALDAPDPENFTDYLELDHTDILGFVWDKIGRTETENTLRAELDEMRAPKTTKLATMQQQWLADCCPDGQNIDSKGAVTTVSE
jgi:hypothetical protein